MKVDVNVRRKIDITPAQMAEEIIEDSDFEVIFDGLIRDMLICNHDVEKDDAEDAVYNITMEEYIKILEAVVTVLKKKNL